LDKDKEEIVNFMKEYNYSILDDIDIDILMINDDKE
jgi:hypothetical protein